MALGFVDQLEVVEADDQHADQPALALGHGQRLRQLVTEHGPRRQSGQAVEMRLALCIQGGGLVVSDVMRLHSNPVAVRARRGANVKHPLADGNLGAFVFGLQQRANRLQPVTRQSTAQSRAERPQQFARLGVGIAHDTVGIDSEDRFRRLHDDAGGIMRIGVQCRVIRRRSIFPPGHRFTPLVPTWSRLGTCLGPPSGHKKSRIRRFAR